MSDFVLSQILAAIAVMEAAFIASNPFSYRRSYRAGADPESSSEA
jgi:hypothetical protein